MIERLKTGADADQRSYLKIKDPTIIISKDARRDHQGNGVIVIVIVCVCDISRLLIIVKKNFKNVVICSETRSSLFKIN